MKLPWNTEEKDQKIKELKEELEELEDEKESLENQLKAEKKRRSKLSTEKQEAEKEKKKLEDRLRTLEGETDRSTENGETGSWIDLEFEQAKRILEKINSIESPEKDLVTVQTPGKLTQVPDLKGLKNTLSSVSYSRISSEKSFISFLDEDFLNPVLKTRPFLKAEWYLDKEFSTDGVLNFIREEKIWVTVSANKTEIFHEQNGESSRIESITTRVNKKQKKGGFSQGRFERKRDEQIQEHLEKTREKLQEFENVKLLGERSLCEDLEGEYLGGFDSSKPAGPDMFYSFQLKKSH